MWNRQIHHPSTKARARSSPKKGKKRKASSLPPEVLDSLRETRLAVAGLVTGVRELKDVVHALVTSQTQLIQMNQQPNRAGKSIITFRLSMSNESKPNLS